MIMALPNTFEKGIRSIHDEPKMDLGEIYHSARFNTFYTYVRFAENVEVGDAVRTKYNLLDRGPSTSRVAAKGSRQIIEADATFLTTLEDAGVPRIPNWRDMTEIYIDGNTGVGQHGVVQQFNNTTLNVLWYSNDPATRGLYTDGTLDTALANDSNYVITAPWLVEKTGNTTPADDLGDVNGIVIVPAKKHQYGLITHCSTDFVKVSGAVKAGQMLYVDEVGTTDEGEGEVPAAAPRFKPYATCLHAAAANTLVRANVYCTPISIVPDLSHQAARGFRRPGKLVAA